MIELTILFVQYVILKPLGLYTPPPDEKKMLKAWLMDIGYYEFRKKRKNPDKNPHETP